MRSSVALVKGKGEKLVAVLGHLGPGVGVLVAIFGAILSNDAPKQHGFICFAKTHSQFRLHLVPAQTGCKDLVWTLHQVVLHVSADSFLSIH